MKKYFDFLRKKDFNFFIKKHSVFLVILFFVLAIPIVSFADIHGTNECCKLDYDFTSVDGTCSKDAIVGPQTPDWCDVDGDEVEEATTATIEWGNCCLLNTIYNISDWLLWIFMIMALIFGVIAGFFFMFSGGDPQRVSSAKTFLICTIVAILIVSLSKLIPAMIKSIVA